MKVNSRILTLKNNQQKITAVDREEINKNLPMETEGKAKIKMQRNIFNKKELPSSSHQHLGQVK